jgi:hypothetical protein
MRMVICHKKKISGSFDHITLVALPRLDANVIQRGVDQAAQKSDIRDLVSNVARKATIT